jgi:hypothetical protein
MHPAHSKKILQLHVEIDFSFCIPICRSQVKNLDVYI